MIAQDGFNGVGQPSLQGRGQASIDYFWNETVAAFQVQLGRTPGTQGVQAGQTPRDTFNAVCGEALQDAANRATAMGYPATAADSRVVGVYFSYAVGSVNWFMSSVPSSEYSAAFAPSWDNEVNNPTSTGFAYDGSREAYAQFEQDGMPALDAIAGTWRAHVDGVIAANPTAARYFTCVALNEFEPQVGFEVSVHTRAGAFTAPGGSSEEKVWLELKEGYAWPAGVSLAGEAVAYRAGPFDPTVSATPPAGASPVGSTPVTVSGPGEANAQGVSLPVGSNVGRVTWVVTFRAADQSHGMLLADAAHEYGLPNETTVVPAKMGGVSQVTVKGGQEAKDAVFLEDTFKPAPLPGQEWIAGPDGKTLVSVNYRWTAYRVDRDIPQDTLAAVPAGAVQIDTGVVTATGPGDELRARVENPFPDPSQNGSVIWVWEVREEDQDPANAPYIVAGWIDGYAVEAEVTHVPSQPECVTSASVRHTAAGTFMVDDLFCGDLPDNYGDYTGSLGFDADVSDFTHTMLWFPAGLEVLEATREAAQVIGSVQVPATNGFQPSVGSTAFLVPGTGPGQACQEGTAVFITEHPGSARVLPLSTSVEDIHEQYPVRCVGPRPSIDVEKADEVATGAGNGTDAPDNAGAGIDHDTKETAKVVKAGQETVISITVTNNADETLKNVWVADQTISGAPMAVNDGSFVVVDADGAELYSVQADTLTVTRAETGKYSFTIDAGAGLLLAPGQSIRFTGTIPAQEAGDEPHANQATVGGTGEISGILVGDTDDYHTTVIAADTDAAIAAADADTARALALTGARNIAVLFAAGLVLAITGGVLLRIRDRRHADTGGPGSHPM